MRAKRRVVCDSNRANCKGKQLHGASVGEDETEHNTCSCDPNDTPLPERRFAESSVPESISYDRQFLQGVLRQLLCGPYTDREGENLAHWKTGIDMLRAVFPALQSFSPDQPHDIGEKPASLDSASNLSRNHWVSTSAQELGTFLKQGRALNAHTPTLRISNTFERFQDAEAAFLRFAQHREVGLMYQNWEIIGGSTSEMTAQDFCKRYEVRMSKERRATSDEFRNLLSISGAALEHVVPGPDCLRNLGYSLLNDLKVQVHLDEQSQFGPAGGKETKTRTIDCEACLQFVLYGERFSFSGWHLDVLNGTWLTTITGFRAWFIYTGPWTEKEQKELETSGAQWRPAAEHVEIILLRPGDTLIMRPSHPVVHCVLTLDDSIARGGII
ncbi:uncharacterized protein J4E87_010306 [Alternaria ethzedia]|uniref:uncharacterized protein n=1 Tax=Alternaria ethzedia TaxID=181014 RepID=UPI0020C1ED26|nr:uncharacterized protein J4E87_010306 [Alternaria ethzedia]KAI4612116.1 hypothetical protein J4E87_010306 [Alternaria ethzedia]